MLYHLSDKWTEKSLVVTPRIIRADDPNDPRDMKPCVAVTPSILQCIIALGGWRDYPKVNVYVTDSSALPASWIFDYEITHEHRIYEPAVFKRLGSIDLPHYSRILPYRVTCGISDDDILRHTKQDYNDLKDIFG